VPREQVCQTDQKKELFRTVQKKELRDRRQNEEQIHMQIQEAASAKLFPVIVICAVVILRATKSSLA
jgi:hypothetical protein